MRVFLGRHVEHDERSRNFALDDIDDVMQATVQTVIWHNISGVLDQGNLGACVGYSTAAAVGTTPNSVGVEVADYQALGLHMYEQATLLDNVPGQYPPDDTGSSGLGGAKAAKKAGLIAAYNHAFSFDALLKALQIGPVIVGTNWYYGMFSPRVTGEVALGASDDQVAGGHEYMVYGVRAQENALLCQNSWGKGWGEQGKFWMGYDLMERLLSEKGDVTQFVPVPVPAPPEPTPSPTPDPEPTPSPAPQPDPDDAKLWAATQAWAKAKGLT